VIYERISHFTQVTASSAFAVALTWKFPEMDLSAHEQAAIILKRPHAPDAVAASYA